MTVVEITISVEVPDEETRERIEIELESVLCPNHHSLEESCPYDWNMVSRGFSSWEDLNDWWDSLLPPV